MREQRLVFGEEPELYDRARPGYSDAVVDDVLAFAGIEPARPALALEIGAGTGKATVAFARRGLQIVAVEPDPAMAAVAARNCEPFSGVRIVQAPFEEWPVEEGAFELVFSAQAWHWVQPEVRAARAAAALAPGACLALLWHRVRWEEGDPVRADLDECYRRYAPELHARRPGFPGLTPRGFEEAAHGEIAARPEFVDVAVHDHRWEASVDPQSLVDLLATQSDHRLLPAATRERLLGAVHAVVVAHGGRVCVPYTTLVVLARRAA